MIDDNSKKRIHNAIANAVVKVKVAGSFRGTGFVITPDGYVLTAYHCVGEYASDITIETRFGDTFAVELDKVKSLKQPQYDIAVLKVYQRNPFTCVPLGGLTSQNIGDEVVTIGYPAGHLPEHDKISTYVAKIAQWRSDNKVQIPDAIKGQGQSGSPMYHYNSRRIIGLVTEGYKLDVITDAGLVTRVEVLFENWPELALINKQVASDWDESLQKIVTEPEEPTTVAYHKTSKEWPLVWIVLAFLGVLTVLLWLSGGLSPHTTVTVKDNAKVDSVHTGIGDIVNQYGVSEERFLKLAEEFGVTKAALRNFFGIIKKQQVPSYELDSTLREIAKRYKELMTKVDSLSSDDPEVAALISQAQQALEKGEFDRAEALFNQASDKDIEAAQRLQATANKRLVSAAESLAANGELKLTQLAYQEAGEYYEKAANLLPAGHDETLASYLNWAGRAFNDAALYNQAKPLFKQALIIREKVLGGEHPDTATSLNNLAELYREKGDYTKTEPLYQRALAIWEKVHGKEHPLVATGLNNLAVLYKAQGDYTKAEPLFQRALAILEKVHSKEHPLVATSLNNLAVLYCSQGYYTKAEPLYQRALAIDEKVYGKEHPDVARDINNLALLYNNQGDYTKAEPLYQRALAIFEKVLGSEHPNTQVVKGNYAKLLEEMNQKD